MSKTIFELLMWEKVLPRLRHNIKRYYGSILVEELQGEKLLLVTGSKGVYTGLYIESTPTTLNIYRSKRGEYKGTNYIDSLEKDISQHVYNYAESNNMLMQPEYLRQRDGEFAYVDKYIYSELVHGLYLSKYSNRLNEYIDEERVYASTGIKEVDYKKLQPTYNILLGILEELPKESYRVYSKLNNYLSIGMLESLQLGEIYIQSIEQGEHILLRYNSNGEIRLQHKGSKVEKYRDKDGKRKERTHIVDTGLQDIYTELIELSKVTVMTRVHLRKLKNIIGGL